MSSSLFRNKVTYKIFAKKSYIYWYIDIYICKQNHFLLFQMEEKVDILTWTGPQSDLYSFNNYLVSYYTCF